MSFPFSTLAFGLPYGNDTSSLHSPAHDNLPHIRPRINKGKDYGLKSSRPWPTIDYFPVSYFLIFGYVDDKAD